MRGVYNDEEKRTAENTIICSCSLVYNDFDVDDYVLCKLLALTIQWRRIGNFTGNDSGGIVRSCSCKYDPVYENKRYGVREVAFRGWR